MAVGDSRSAAAVALTTAALAGCGGDGGGDGGADRPRKADPLVVYHVEERGKSADLRVEADGRTFARGGVPGGRCPPKARRFRMSGGELASLKAQLARVPRTKQRTGVGDHPRALDIRLEAGGARFHYAGRHSVPQVLTPLIVQLSDVIAFRCGAGP
jgi:hypothetical protein